jgi:uncharacterized protein YuzE
MITTTYDREADALYVRFAPEDTTIQDTREVAPGILLDVGTNGAVVGIEVLSVSLREGASATDTVPLLRSA